MDLIITIDDKTLPLVMRAYGVTEQTVHIIDEKGISSEREMDEKEQKDELISRIQERLYSYVYRLKQQDVANAVEWKATELVVSIKT